MLYEAQHIHKIVLYVTKLSTTVLIIWNFHSKIESNLFDNILNKFKGRIGSIHYLNYIK